MKKFNNKINITKEQWKDILFNNSVVKPEDRELLFNCYISENQTITAYDITLKLNKKGPMSYNSPVGYLGKRVLSHFNISADWVSAKEKNYWHVIFLSDGDNKDGHFTWKLRPELKEAIDDIVLERLIC